MVSGSCKRHDTHLFPVWPPQCDCWRHLHTFRRQPEGQRRRRL